MESETESQLSTSNPLSRFLKHFEKMGLWSEVIWPIGSLFLNIRPLHHWLIGHATKIEKGQKVLETYSGYPLYKLYADRVGEGGLFVAADINPGVQSRSRKICYWIDKFFNKKALRGRITPVVADAKELPFADNSFDIIIASNYYGGRSSISETYRALKPGGKVIYAWNELLSVPIITAKQVKECKEVGFEEVKIRPGAPGSIIPGEMWNWYMVAAKPTLNRLRT